MRLKIFLLMYILKVSPEMALKTKQAWRCDDAFVNDQTIISEWTSKFVSLHSLQNLPGGSKIFFTGQVHTVN